MLTYPHKGLTLQMVLGVFVGLLIGLFFKEQAHLLAPVGRAFIMLLQMPVLIFMFCSIIVGIGSMTLRDAKSIFSSAIIFLAGSWLFTKVCIVLIPLALPPIKHIHHFASLLSAGSDISLINAFIPENPFKSFAEGAVPAVVVFSLFFGLALLHVKNRFMLLSNISVAQEASMVMVRFVTKLSFFGLAAITASGFHRLGHMALPELKYYYLAFIFGAVFVSVVMLPLLVTVFMPISYHRLMLPLMPALLLAVVTGNIIITLPLVLSALETNSKECGFMDSKTHGVISALVPLSINFPVSGKLLNLLFLYFASWHYQDAIKTSDEVLLTITGFLTSFGSAEEGINYLLDSLKLPHDAMILFEASLEITGKFIALARVASISALCFFTISSFEHRLTFKPKTLLLGIWVVVASFSGWFLYMGKEKPLDQEENPFASLSIHQPVSSTIVSDSAHLDARPHGAASLLESITASKVLRVGFNINTNPFAYFNKYGELVGHDIELAHRLAKDLGVDLVFVPFTFSELAGLLKAGTIDIAMSGVSITKERLLHMGFSNSYAMSEHVLVTKDYNLKEFDTLLAIEKRPDVIIAALAGSSLYEEARLRFKNHRVTPLTSYGDFIGMADPSLLYWATPQATHWILQNPQFGMLKIAKLLSSDELAFAMPKDAHDLIDYVNQWMGMQKASGAFDELYKKWVVGNN